MSTNLQQQPHRIPDKIPHFAKYTQDVGLADPSSEINFSLVLKIRNADWIEHQLKDVSDPKSKNYGKHLGQDEIESMTRPTQQHFDKVTNFLQSQGIQSTRDGDNLKVKTTVDKVQKLFSTQIHKFAQPSGNKDDTIFKGEGGFKIPTDISDCGDLVGYVPAQTRKI
ncbi:hypothetical protein DICPUDRAFT_152810 [Dictyostelium purpureum]|uniref:Peptidase S53 activation domain-containing protein n=1 Tax=Dictyostelium purpureum TaxID=5786 RepID=F0ZMB7_DICPU|nr:uncharacterized protein DICPUDRAFT_152810 [Dictyostelium purpureum]EGC34916.1 hypothetical protein DICPUDRAFT_152810 [Dictyostelium purpureum]|eukprot:XP_003288549.1 hypothetical protein DICPUDRAFT_152810 [Dictyostelium purpureum]